MIGADFLNYDLGPPAAYLAAGGQGITCFCLVAQGNMQGNPDLGWRPKSLTSRILMYIVAIVFAVNLIFIIEGAFISVKGVALALSMASWRFYALMEAVVEGWRKEAIKIALAPSVIFVESKEHVVNN